MILDKLNSVLKDETSRYFWAGIFSVSILFFIYYPRIYAFLDEGVYMSSAYLLRKGALFLEGQNIPTSVRIYVSGRQVPYYPLGNSFLLYLLSFGGWKALFLLGWLAHVGGAILFRKLARLFDAENTPVLLGYIFFPSFILFSRTLMSDLPSLFLFLAACVAYFEPKCSKWSAGVLLGLNLFMRISNVILIAPFGLGVLIDAVRKKNAEGLISFLLGVIPLGFFMGIYNQFFYAAPHLSGASYYLGRLPSFSFHYLLPNLRHYLISLNSVYPGLLILGFLNPKIWRKEVLILGILLLSFFSLYFFHDYFSVPFATIVVGNRYFFPLIVFLILGYGSWIQQWSLQLPEGFKKGGRLVFFGGFVFCAFFIHKQHDAALKKQETIRDSIYQSTENQSVLIYTQMAAEFLQAAWGDRYYVPYVGPQTVSDALKSYSGRVPVYLVDKDTGSFNRLGKQSEFAIKDLDPLRKQFELQPVLSQSGLQIYRVTARNSKFMLTSL